MLTHENIKLEAAREAVTRLGYLKLETISLVASLMAGGMVEHPREVTTAYRKDGEQLSREEKKAIGIRANSFLSRRAFGDLAEKGKACPLTAHETTLLRALFTENRFQRLNDGIPEELKRTMDGIQYETFSLDCPFCSLADGKVVRPENIAILPAQDCECETANYTIRPKFDFLKNID